MLNRSNLSYLRSSISTRLCLKNKSQQATFIIPTKKRNVVDVYKPTRRLIPKGANALIQTQSNLLQQYDPTGWKQDFISRTKEGHVNPGDIVRVQKSDDSSFIGMVIAINRNNLSTTIELRNKIQGTGVESIFNVFNPQIVAMDILRNPVKLKKKAKLFYLRGNVKYDVGDLDAEIRKSQRRRK